MVDVVANHMAYEGTAATINYGSINPFNNKNYFHPTCWVNDYNNQTDVENVNLHTPHKGCHTDLIPVLAW